MMKQAIKKSSKVHDKTIKARWVDGKHTANIQANKQTNKNDYWNITDQIMTKDLYLTYV